MIGNKIVAMSAPFVCLYLWHAHCSYVFPASSVSRHAMTVQNYMNIFSYKEEGDIISILLNVCKLSISGKQLYYLILFMGMVGILSYFCEIQMQRHYVKWMLVCAFAYITYMIGMAGMYLFSMPGEEATNLAGNERYRGTIFVAIYYLLFAFSLKIISSIENIRKNWICVMGVYVTLFVVWAGEGDKPFPIIFRDTVDEERIWLEEVMEDYELPVGASYLIYAKGNPTSRYLHHMCRYFLWSDNVTYVDVEMTSVIQFDEKAANFEYILLHDNDNAYIQEWVQEKYPEQVGKSVIENLR